MNQNKGRTGPDNPNAKYSNAQVVMMREYRHGGWSHADLSLLFGCSPGTSSLICRGKAYRDAGGPIEGKYRAYNHAVNYREPKLAGEAEEVRQYRNRGLSHQAIADQLGISKSKVGSILRKQTRY